MEYDPFVTTPELSNPWLSDDPSLWDLEARYRRRNLGLLIIWSPMSGSADNKVPSFCIFDFLLLH